MSEVINQPEPTSRKRIYLENRRITLPRGLPWPSIGGSSIDEIEVRQRTPINEVGGPDKPEINKSTNIQAEILLPYAPPLPNIEIK